MFLVVLHEGNQQGRILNRFDSLDVDAPKLDQTIDKHDLCHFKMHQFELIKIVVGNHFLKGLNLLFCYRRLYDVFSVHGVHEPYSCILLVLRHENQSLNDEFFLFFVLILDKCWNQYEDVVLPALSLAISIKVECSADILRPALQITILITQNYRFIALCLTEDATQLKVLKVIHIERVVYYALFQVKFLPVGEELYVWVRPKHFGAALL